MNYPFELQRREALAIRARREKAAPFAASAQEAGEGPQPEAAPPGVDLGRLPPRTVGLALCGGGIRAATFSLGILQALAKKGRLRQIDFLSSVSGGGYAASFLGRLFIRSSIASLAENKGEPCARVESILGADDSPQIQWLRQNANYLAGAGGSDARQDVAIFWRNLVTIYFILALLGLALFGLLRLAGDWVARSAGAPGIVLALGLARISTLNPWWWLPPAVLGVAVVPCAIAYWLAPKRYTRASFSFFPIAGWLTILSLLSLAAGVASGTFGVLTAIVVLLFAAVWLEGARRQLPANVDPSSGESSADPGTVIRNRLTLGLGESLAILLVCVLWAAMDTLARAVALGELNSVTATWTLLVALGTPILRPVAASLLAGATQKANRGQPSRLLNSARFLAGIIAFPIAGLLVVLVDGAVHWLFNRQFAWGIVAFLAGTVLSLIFGRAFDFLNYSTLQNTYRARISRVFLGASNPARISGDASEVGRDVQLVHPDDDVAFSDYHPEANGGPVHLIGLCVNETVDSVSPRGVRARKGLPMCVGPCGVSVGRKYHATWVPPPPVNKLPCLMRLRQLLDGFDTPSKNVKTALRAVPVSGEVFHVFQGKTDSPVCVESLRLSGWIATSAAAFGTGSGRATSLPISLLLGLVNLRLGYWWNSGLNASDRPGRYLAGFWRKLKTQPVAFFKMQSLLISDILGRILGPAHRFWNISDGGHFDGTGIYELLRRRVPFVIAADGSEDASFDFNDVAGLVRQARIDFGAKVEFVDPVAVVGKLPAWILGWLSHPDKTLGSLREIGQPNRTHAALAQVTYDGDQEPATWIVLLKASVTGDESFDVTSYKRSNPAFPREPTTGQFFNEAQWESYRALGEHIGETVLTLSP